MPVPAVEPDCDRAVVAEVDLHVGPETAGFHVETRSTAMLYEIFEHRLGDFRLSSPGEPRPATPPGVRCQRELADYQEAACDVED